MPNTGAESLKTLSCLIFKEPYRLSVGLFKDCPTLMNDTETMDVLTVLLSIPEVKHSYGHNPSKCHNGKLYLSPRMLPLLKITFNSLSGGS